jgi:hypothetical protein
VAKFTVVLERTDTITKQAELLVEASTAEEARQIILGDLEVDAGSYDDELQPVEEGIGDETVTVEKQHEPKHRSAETANA